MKTKIGLIIFTVLPLLTGISETKACIGHLLQDNWPPHAMFHMFMGLGGLLATYGLILFLTWGPLKRGTDGGLRNQEAIVASGSFLIGAIVVILLLYGIGLALTWSHTHK